MSIRLDFDPSLFNNRFGLEKVVRDEGIIKSVSTRSEKSSSIQVPTTKTPYFNRWSVVWIHFSFPLFSALSTTFWALAKVCSLLFLDRYSAYLTVQSKLASRNWEQLSSQWRLEKEGITLLGPSINIHKSDSFDTFGHLSIPYAAIQDPRVLALTNDYTKKMEMKAVINGEVRKVVEQILTKLKEKAPLPVEEPQTSSWLPSFFTKKDRPQDSLETDLASELTKLHTELEAEDELDETTLKLHLEQLETCFAFDDVFSIEELGFDLILDGVWERFYTEGAQSATAFLKEALGKIIDSSYCDFAIKQLGENLFDDYLKKDPKFAIDSLSKTLDPFDQEVSLLESPLYTRLKELDQKMAGKDKITLYEKASLGRGSSLWFIYLFLKTGGLFPQVKQQLVSIAREFKNGVGRQGALLNSLENTDDLLGIESKLVKETKITLYELDLDHESAAQKLQSLQAGVYRLNILDHSLALICLKDGQMFVFDSYFGLFETDGTGILNHIANHHHLKGDPRSFCTFEQFEVEALASDLFE